MTVAASEANNGKTDCIFDYDRWNSKLRVLKEQYRTASPFPFIALDQFLEPEIAAQAAAQFPKPDSGPWVEYRHFNTKKLGQNKRELLPSHFLKIIEELNSPRFVRFISELTGIPNLISDPYLEGGGIHQISAGGFLNIHADFTSHVQEPLWARRVNILIYLNENWKEEFGGHLEFWDQKMEGCRAKILPVINRCVIFSTGVDTFHGHPEPLACPADMTRKSIALYYFSIEKKKPLARSTEYRPRPVDSPGKSILITIDKFLLRAYDFGRRRLGIRDEYVSKFLKWFR